MQYYYESTVQVLIKDTIFLREYFHRKVCQSVHMSSMSEMSVCPNKSPICQMYSEIDKNAFRIIPYLNPSKEVLMKRVLSRMFISTSFCTFSFSTNCASVCIRLMSINPNFVLEIMSGYIQVDFMYEIIFYLDLTSLFEL